MVNSSKFKLQEVVDYLRNPLYKLPTKYTIKNNTTYFLKSYLWCFLSVVATTALLTALDKILVYCLEQPSIYQQFKQSNLDIKRSFGPYSIVIIVIVGPLIEEVVFRLPLAITKTGISLAISVLTFRLMGNSFASPDIKSNFYLISILLSAIILFLTKYTLQDKWLNSLKGNRFKYFFYILTIIFGLVHLSNVKAINFSILPFYPFFVLPQLVIGFFIANLRMQRGFVWGLFLHSAINLTSFLFSH